MSSWDHRTAVSGLSVHLETRHTIDRWPLQRQFEGVVFRPLGSRKRAYEALCNRGRGLVARAEDLLRGLPTAPTIQARVDQESRLSSPRQGQR